MARISTQEYLELLAGERRVIVRGGFWKKPPYQRVFTGDILYLVDKYASHSKALKVEVARVVNRQKKAWDTRVPILERAGMKRSDKDQVLLKRYVVLVELNTLTEVDSVDLPRVSDRWSLGTVVGRK